MKISTFLNIKSSSIQSKTAKKQKYAGFKIVRFYWWRSFLLVSFKFLTSFNKISSSDFVSSLLRFNGFPFLTKLMSSFSSTLSIHWIKSVSNISMVCSSVLHLLHRFSISDDIWRAWVSFSLTDFFSFSDFKYFSYFILADRKAFIIDESVVIVYGFRLFASLWSLIIRLEI